MENRFEIIKPLAGQGGYGKVDKANDKELERPVAIKTLDPLFKNIDSKDVERFRREAKALAALSHPNIPAIYDVVFNPEKDEFKIIYAWIEGKTMREYLAESGLLSLENVRKFFGNICSALSHSHQKNIIHRDIKPSNLIITTNLESCYVVDFGVSLTTGDIQRLTNSPSSVGTPGYMSPEQENNQEVDFSTDVYSLGIVLYECLGGVRPSVGEYKPLNTINEAIPSSIDSLIRDCIKSKNERLKTVDEFIIRLNNALRPSTNIGLTFSQGAIADIINSLQSFNHISFNNLPVGQKVLLITKLKTLIATNEFRLRNPIAAFLESLLKVCGRLNENEFRFIVKNALIYGFSMQYGESWIGNPSIRKELGIMSLQLEQNQHKILSEEVLSFIEGSDIKKVQDWHIFDLKNILQNLLGNEVCDEEMAIKLGEKLEQVLYECYND